MNNNNCRVEVLSRYNYYSYYQTRKRLYQEHYREKKKEKENKEKEDKNYYKNYWEKKLWKDNIND